MRASSIDDNAAMAEKMSVRLHMNFENGVPRYKYTRQTRKALAGLWLSLYLSPFAAASAADVFFCRDYSA